MKMQEIPVLLMAPLIFYNIAVLRALIQSGNP